jgi:hypothetical protein
MKLIFSGILLFQISCFTAQVDSVSYAIVDTNNVYSPKKAIIYSAILPGAGQVYNHIAMPKGQKKAFWKVPLIYAGIGTMGYFLLSNQLTQKSLKEEYIQREAGLIVDPKWSQYDQEGVLTLYNQYLNWRDLSILGFTAVYLLQVVDAGIEAHFVKFDISEDLSLTIQPRYFGQQTIGLNLNLNFH